MEASRKIFRDFDLLTHGLKEDEIDWDEVQVRLYLWITPLDVHNIRFNEILITQGYVRTCEYEETPQRCSDSAGC